GGLRPPLRLFLLWTVFRAPRYAAGMNAGEHRDYRVNLDTFRGPLDLLLYLVKRDEVDVRDIPIARVCQQFKDYLDALQWIDVEQAGEFLVVMCTLLEIKARMLLPRPEESAEPEDDPRLELVKQLVQYKKFKDAAALLEARAEEQGQRLPRQPISSGSEAQVQAAPPPMKPVELWDLVSAFGRLMRETLALQPQTIAVDQTPLHVYMETILRLLQAAKRLPFSALFAPPHTRGRLVGLFLAILELTKTRRVVPEQDDASRDIWVSLNDTIDADGPVSPQSRGDDEKSPLSATE
ncbi:MAG: segregation and condensation protein A, partial [Gemmataceae bacterium]